MDNQRLQRHRLAIRRLARAIYIAAIVAGRPITRGDLSDAFGRLQWRPTMGEIHDALHYLESIGKISSRILAGNRSCILAGPKSLRCRTKRRGPQIPPEATRGKRTTSEANDTGNRVRIKLKRSTGRH